MDSPFFTSHWDFPSHPRYAPSVRGLRPQTKTVRSPTPKVVSIPVHFIESERVKPDSAAKIQKVFRGFLVRKCLKKIAALRKEANEIELSVSKKETVDLIRRDSSERLRVIEMLMSLLFRLDSVRGVDSGVRDCRKAVIKRVIALQELVDAIVAGHQTVESDVVDENQTVEVVQNAADPTEANDGNVEGSVTDSADNRNCCESGDIDRPLGTQNHDEKTIDADPLPNLSESEAIRAEGMDASNEENPETTESNKETTEDQEYAEESVGTSRTESRSDSSANPQSLTEGGEGGNSVVNEALQADYERKENVKIESCSDVEENKSRELLERMMEESERMMGLMAQLFERNEMQTRLLSSLSQRVEQLEKGFMCEKLRRKKRRNAATAVDDKCSEK